jgi:hypothetical protein
MLLILLLAAMAFVSGREFTASDFVDFDLSPQ